MSDHDRLALVKSFLTKSTGTATETECRAWAEFSGRYARIIRARIGAGHRGWIDADDFFQLVSITLINRVKTSRLDAAVVSLEVCIAKIVHDIVLRHTRRLTRRREQPLTPDLAGEMPDPDDELEAQVERLCLHEEIAGLLAHLRASLSERNYRVAVRRWLDNRSVAEIAAEFKLTEDCVSSILHRVCLKLREPVRRSGLDASEKKLP